MVLLPFRKTNAKPCNSQRRVKVKTAITVFSPAPLTLRSTAAAKTNKYSGPSSPPPPSPPPLS
ncbi:hypothetical protein E2C01_016929 [Portunus trituberculatus]|uniref:Uncharacterized protein n=1 Tax=Portunus trituberculatus TaxID=210409 RepID=A0A5B7DQD3_PORTR|nr:hypothetical protein [Portunus trituberculatus]